MAQQQSSRLNRLLTLLDTGSTSITRRSAAKQIGEIAKQHPAELQPLLKKVRQYLRSKSWDTRVAAAYALGAIAENVRHATLKDVLSYANAEMEKLGQAIDVEKSLTECLNVSSHSASSLTFSRFDVKKVLESGALLLSSGGQEYDVGVDNAKNPAERLARQKQNLRRRLGLDVCEQFMDVNDVIRDEDLMISRTFSGSNGENFMHSLSYQLQGGRQEVQQLVANMVPGVVMSKTLSARERNMLKRKAKFSGPKEWAEDQDVEEPSAKRANTTTARPFVMEQSNTDKLVMESGLEEDQPDFIGDGQWPFARFVELLIHDMFDPVWEVRHGSIMALREILSSQAASAAVVVPDFSSIRTSDANRNKNNGPQRDVCIDLNLDVKPDIKEEAIGNGVICQRMQSHSSATAPMTELSLSIKQEHDMKDRNGTELEHDKNDYSALPLPINDACTSFANDSRALEIYLGAQHSWTANMEFLQDCTIRLLCVFALDRFGDYVSDQVVAPVRETCAQALGAVVKQMHPVLVHKTLNILLQMQNRAEWEVRHGSLLGIKYLVAVRQEMVEELLPCILPTCMAGLEDADDDVRAVAAESLLPAARAIVSHAGHLVDTILLRLWDILLDLDDLSPSTSSVMHLLAEIYCQPKVVPQSLGNKQSNERPIFDLNKAFVEDRYDSMDSVDNPFLLSNLAPRLWPFMRHNISSVRLAAIRTLERLLEAGNLGDHKKFWALPILGDMVRVVFQNLLMESNEEILECSGRVWKLLLQSAQENVAAEVDLYFLSWLKLASTSSGSPLENSKMFSPNMLPRGSRFKAEAKLKAAGSNISGGSMLHSQRQKNIDNAFVPKVVVGADGEKSAIQMRVVTSSALGVLCATVPESTFGVIVNGLSELLASPSGIQRQVASLVLVSWFKELRVWPKEKQLQAATASKAIYARIQELLSLTDQLPTPNSLLPYAELTRTYTKLRGDAGAFIKQAETVGCFKNLVATSLPLLEGMNAEAAIELTKTFTQEDTNEVGSVEDKQCWDMLESGRQRVLATAGYLQCIQVNLHSSVLASLAGAVVWMGELPTKLNPIIKPLMASVKREQEEVLQRSAAEALAEVIAQCVGRKPCPNERLIKNISTLICADPSETPIATSANASWFSFDDDAAGSMKPPTGLRAKAELGVGNDERAKIEGAITRRGAELALRSLCQKFEEHVFEKLPKLWGCITEAIKPASSDELGSCVEEVSSVLQADGEPQPLINNLQLIRSIAPFLDKTLHSRVLSLLPAILGCVRHNHAAVRFAAAKCITAMAKTLIEPVMIAVLSKGIPMLEDTSVEARQGGGMLVASLVDGLGLDLVPYAPLLIVPLLGCMSDSNHIVRQNIAHSFAALVPLLPLARGLPQPAGLQQFQASKNLEDSRFLEQLLDNRKVDDYKLSVELKTTLRRYQQEGINWLAFLKRFKLHGILCDDMGLGKTIQASAVLASDIAERAKDGSSSETADRSPLQSLVVCPSTLVGHWVYEIEKFIPLDVLKPMQYVGSPQERLQLRDLFASHNLIITSYDVLRKDIDALSEIAWNYCILDEGHIIKSAKSKITLSVKRLQAEHRLILSGTPIQNNVLELWSLFDFLMPGFLGSERQFQATYGKPLLAARDPKCSAKEAEAGVLAMEALHKQVMPFLLRRTKEEVLSDLPPKIIQDRYCDLSPLQLRLYENFSRSQAKKEVANLVKAYGNLDTPDSRPISGGASTHVFQALQYLRKLCSHPLLVLNELHGQSASDILESLSEENKADLHDLQHAPKLLALREILEECGIGLQSVGTECGGTGQHRVLVFAQLKSFLDIIEKDLFHSHMKGVTYLRLDGSVESDKRFDIVKTFNSDPTIDVLLLTTHVGGLGLNLTAADTVVFVEHDWNPMRDLQAMDRAHRLGQRRVVNVHRLIMCGTLEEKVMSLQRFKLSIAASVINAENASLNSMDTTQLLDLFTVSGTHKKAAKPSIEEGEDSTGPNGKGLKAMLSSLEELWDQSQYSEEYNLSQFVARLKD